MITDHYHCRHNHTSMRNTHISQLLRVPSNQHIRHRPSDILISYQTSPHSSPTAQRQHRRNSGLTAMADSGTVCIPITTDSILAIVIGNTVLYPTPACLFQSKTPTPLSHQSRLYHGLGIGPVWAESGVRRELISVYQPNQSSSVSIRRSSPLTATAVRTVKSGPASIS